MKSQTVTCILKEMETGMTKRTIANYLQHESKTIGHLIAKFNRLKTWNDWLQDCLPDEGILLQHCQIVGLDKASLIVIADNPHWVTRFRFFIPELLIQLRHYEDFKHIKAICCKTRPPHYRVSQLKRKPLIISSQTAEMMKLAADRIKNEKLKNMLMRIAKKHLSDNTNSE